MTEASLSKFQRRSLRSRSSLVSIVNLLNLKPHRAKKTGLSNRKKCARRCTINIAAIEKPNQFSDESEISQLSVLKKPGRPIKKLCSAAEKPIRNSNKYDFTSECRVVLTRLVFDFDECSSFTVCKKTDLEDEESDHHRVSQFEDHYCIEPNFEYQTTLANNEMFDFCNSKPKSSRSRRKSLSVPKLFNKSLLEIISKADLEDEENDYTLQRRKNVTDRLMALKSMDYDNEPFFPPSNQLSDIKMKSELDTELFPKLLNFN